MKLHYWKWFGAFVLRPGLSRDGLSDKPGRAAEGLEEGGREGGRANGHFPATLDLSPQPEWPRDGCCWLAVPSIPPFHVALQNILPLVAWSREARPNFWRVLLPITPRLVWELFPGLSLLMLLVLFFQDLQQSPTQCPWVPPGKAACPVLHGQSFGVSVPTAGVSPGCLPQCGCFPLNWEGYPLPGALPDYTAGHAPTLAGALWVP